MNDKARNRTVGILPDSDSIEGLGEAACYARLSDAKLGRESSIEDQVRECREEARRDGNFIPDANLFDDIDVRGATESRPGLDRLMDLVRSGKATFKNLYIADTSRLARNSSLAPKLRKFFKAHGIRLHFVENGMKSGTSGFDLQHTFQAYFDELYSEQLGEKVSRGQVGLVLKGYHPSGRCYGYRHVNDEHPTRIGKWNRPVVMGVWQVPFQPEVDVVLDIFRMYAHGEGGYTEIARKLNERGIDSPRKGTRKEGEGWGEATVRHILNNERYIGRVLFGRVKSRRDFETMKIKNTKRDESEWTTRDDPRLQIVPNELWDRVKARQAFMRGRYQKVGGLVHNPVNRRYLLGGLLYCGECGKQMTLTHDRYMCRSALRKTGCKNRRVIHRASLEKNLMETLASSIGSEARLADITTLFMSHLTAELKDRQAAEEGAVSQKSALTEEKTQLEAALRNLAEEVANYGGNDALRSLMRTKNVRLETVKEILSRAEQPAKRFSEEDVTAFLRHALDNLADVLMGDPVRSKQELLKRVASLTLTPIEKDGNQTFAITGDLTLFTEEEMLQLPSTGTGSGELQPVKFSLDNFVLCVDRLGKVVEVTCSPYATLPERGDADQETDLVRSLSAVAGMASQVSCNVGVVQ
jgi:DNA invertase Pin-like site-specific DNA recombinase